MGSSPFSDEQDRKMIEQSLAKSAARMRPYLIYAWDDIFIPFGNWCLNAIALLLLLISSVSSTIASFAMKYWVTFMDRLGRRRIIMDRVNDEPYLERYYIFMKDRSERFPFNIFIHKFLKSDPDDLHDHPWGFFTFIIAGGYWEYQFEDGPPSKVTESKKDESENEEAESCVVPKLVKKWRGLGFFQSVPANHTHRIELDPERPDCWTLFIPRLRVQKWGFFKNNNWIEADQYLAERKKEN